MSYRISKIYPEKGSFSNTKESEYQINFTFKKQKCTVTITAYINDNPYIVNLDSDTDGYHWLHFFLSQDPDCTKLNEDLSYRETTEIINEVFMQEGMSYKQVDKECAEITLRNPFKESDVDIIAKIIEPRFAVRERFFKNDEEESNIKEKKKNNIQELILLPGHGFNTGKYEIHLGKIEQAKNIVAVVKDKKIAERIVKSYNNSLK